MERGSLALLREDWRTYSPRALLRPQFHVVAIYRLSHALGEVDRRRKRPLGFLRSCGQFLLQTIYGVELTWRTRVGRRPKIGHLGGIVIAPDAVIGDDCLIRQNVTIGGVADGGRAPRIGDRVRIGAGAVVIGDIEIGDDVLIGPNAVVTVDVRARSKVVAPPALIIPPAGGTAGSIATVVRERPSPEAVMAVINEAMGSQRVSDPDTPLLSSGVIDSLGVVVALNALEDAFGVTIPADTVTAESFDTARQISASLCGDID